MTVYEAGEEAGVLYLAMRYIDGRDLQALVAEEGPLAPVRAASLVADAGAGLDAVHAAGLVHRDVKPANVLVARQRAAEVAYLTDFGLTKAVGESSGWTATGTVLGTLDFAAPEQVQGLRVDARTDVYALGCILFYALTGRVPFPRDDPSAKVWAHVHDDPPSVSEQGGPRAPALDEVITGPWRRIPVADIPQPATSRAPRWQQRPASS